MKKQVIFLLSISVLTFGQGKTRLPNPINTPKTIEYAPSVTADGQTLVYQSDQFGLFVNSAKKVPKIDAEGKTAVVLDEFETNFFGVYEAKLHPSGTWMPPKQIAAINEYANENMTPVMGGPSISYDGNTLFFFANFGKSGFGREDIYFSERTKSGWTKPENVGSNINTDNYEGFPSISPDGKRLYFTREILGKKVDNKQCYKIMVSEKGRNGKWRLPYELPSPVNLDCEKAPRILADGKTMVFSSIKKEGRGDFDLYKSTMLDNGGWSEPLNLEFINSKKSDLFVSVSPCGDLMYYVSDGDIFTTTIPESLRPIKSATIQGFVLDSITKAPLSTKVVVKENETGNILSVLDNNPSDGRYTAIVPFGKSYNLSVNIPQYFTKTINLEGEQIKDCEPIPLDFKLQIIPTNKEEIVKLALETNRDKVVVDQARLDAEKQKQEQLALEKKQKEEQEKLRLESERLALEKQKQEQLALEKRQKEEQEKLRLESERLALEKQKQEQLALEKKQKEEQEKLRLETERLALEKQKQELLALEKKQKEKQEKLRLETERLALEKQKAEQLVLEKKQKEEQDKLRLESERLALEKQKAEQLALEKKQKEEREKLALEKKRWADSGLTITLLDINTNLPIDGTVVIYRKNNKDSSAYSIKNGTLRIPIAENDTWRIKASAPNYNSIEQVIKIEVPKDASKNFTLELKLEKEVYKIELFAIDLNTIKPIVDAKFVILDFQNKKIVELKADPKGFASFTLPQKGKYTVQLSAPNYKDDEQVINDVKLNTKVTFKPIEIKIPLHELKLFVYDRFTEEELFPDVTSNTKAIGLAPAFIKGPEKTVFNIDLKGENIKPEKHRLAFVDSLINKVSCNLLAQKLFYEFEFRFYDKKTKKPIVRLDHKIIDSDTKSEVQRFSSGKNLALFAPEKSYVFVLNNPNYEPITQKINALDWIKEREFERNIFLNPITQEVAKVEPKVEKVISTKTFGDITKGKKITLENIYFDQSSPVLREESFTQLDELVTVLKDNPDLKIEVRGHTDNVGDLFENVKLSKERCESVITYLTKKGINQTRMVPVGRGPVEPVATNNTEEGRKQNRRVEFVVL